MRKLLVLILFLALRWVNAQVYVDASTAYALEGSISEIRMGIFLNSKTAISLAGGFYTDGISYESFPRIGAIHLHRNKADNFNVFTFGLQLTGIGAQKDLSELYEKKFLRYSPFINIRTPILQLRRDCKCGKPSGLILELVSDLNLTYPFLGIGIRKGFN